MEGKMLMEYFKSWISTISQLNYDVMHQILIPFFKFNDHSYHFKYPDFLYSLLDIGILDKNVQKPTQLLN